MAAMTIDQYKHDLNKQAYKLFINLSPGARIKAQLDYPEFIASNTNLTRAEEKGIVIDDRFTMEAKPKRNGSAKKWKMIYEMYERKKKEYHNQWKDQVAEHAEISRKRMEQLLKKEPEQSNPKPKPQKPRSYLVNYPSPFKSNWNKWQKEQEWIDKVQKTKPDTSPIEKKSTKIQNNPFFELPTIRELSSSQHNHHQEIKIHQKV
jgi:hypothetical protein